MSDGAGLPASPAAERNKQAILDVLVRLWPGPRRVLEIASGLGQHAAHFAAARPDWRWQPSDANPASLATIARRCAGLANVAAPLLVDVRERPWPVSAVDAMYCANMLHVAPRDCCDALFGGARERLGDAAMLVTYGPYFVDGEVPAPTNLSFDADLRARDSAWGIRRLDDVVRAAEAAGFELAERVAMPANNLLLVWRVAPGLSLSA
ncbi:MAG: DUF938 domain-containing protein [Proteobacteria bacterium]|nr:DUF938 domain-containing protein [Pseudomonadota bacterium]